MRSVRLPLFVYLGFHLDVLFPRLVALVLAKIEEMKKKDRPTKHSLLLSKLTSRSFEWKVILYIEKTLYVQYSQ